MEQARHLLRVHSQSAPLLPHCTRPQERSQFPPNPTRRSVSSITGALRQGLGVSVGMECNTDESGSSQLYQIYLCVGNKATVFIDCPLLPRSRCSEDVEFPIF